MRRPAGTKYTLTILFRSFTCRFKLIFDQQITFVSRAPKPYLYQITLASWMYTDPTNNNEIGKKTTGETTFNIRTVYGLSLSVILLVIDAYYIRFSSFVDFSTQFTHIQF